MEESQLEIIHIHKILRFSTGHLPRSLNIPPHKVRTMQKLECDVQSLLQGISSHHSFVLHSLLIHWYVVSNDGWVPFGLFNIGNPCLLIIIQRLKAHSHRAKKESKAKNFFAVRHLFLDLFCLFFDLFHFHFCILLV